MRATNVRQWQRVRERYGKTAEAGNCCGEACCAPSYSEADLAGIPEESMLGLGSGNPIRFAAIQPGETVVDLGSGGGIDVFLAARAAGPGGLAVGIDMTPEMIARARRAASRIHVGSVEFRLGHIEALPLGDESADVVLSNCVINLSPDKTSVFREAYRVLKPGGRLVISDIVQERDLGSVEDDCGCVATAMVRSQYLRLVRGSGFRDLEILEDRPWRRGQAGIEASSITLRALKPGKEETP